jgi:hypothetical protein
MADVLTYNSTVLVKGNGRRALEMAFVVLASAGFRVENKTASSVQCLAPQMIMHSPRNAFPGASKVRIEVAAGRMSMVAELGGVARLRRFLRVLPVCITLFMGLVLGVTFVVKFGAAKIGDWGLAVLAVIVLPLILFAFLGPFIVRHVESHTRTALDTLMKNVTVMMAAA